MEDIYSDCFFAEYEGTNWAFRRQNALEEIDLPIRAKKLFESIQSQNVPVDAAWALACHCVLLSQVLVQKRWKEQEVPYCLSLKEITGLCRTYYEGLEKFRNREWEESDSVEWEEEQI